MKEAKIIVTIAIVLGIAVISFKKSSLNADDMDTKKDAKEVIIAQKIDREQKDELNKKIAQLNQEIKKLSVEKAVNSAQIERLRRQRDKFMRQLKEYEQEK